MLNMDWSIIMGFIGGLLVSVITLIGNIINKRIENKQAYRLSVLENAYKDYELRVKMLDEFRKEGKDVTIYPWDMYVLSYSKIFDLLEKKNYKKSEVEHLLKEIKEIQSIYDNQNKTAR
jgi:pyruvate/2-oxoglutarate/acetoin dehydrogenase E1 component